MTISAPTLAGVTLPHPSEMVPDVIFRGGVTVLADGSLRRDLVDATVMHSWRLVWYALTSTQLGDVQNGFAWAAAAPVVFVDPSGSSYLVTVDEQTALGVTVVKTPGVLRYRVTMALREAPGTVSTGIIRD